MQDQGQTLFQVCFVIVARVRVRRATGMSEAKRARLVQAFPGVSGSGAQAAPAPSMSALSSLSLLTSRRLLIQELQVEGIDDFANCDSLAS